MFDDDFFVMMGYLESCKEVVRKYFPCCPICSSEKMEVNITTGGRDTLSCETCRARWHLYFGFFGFEWAELDIKANDGRGEELLGKQIKGNEWRKMAEKAKEIEDNKES